MLDRSRDRPWKTPGGREARNDQRKLRAAVPNAVAIGAVVTAIIGPSINPTLSGELTVIERFVLALVGIFAHLLASFLVRDMEDR